MTCQMCAGVGLEGLCKSGMYPEERLARSRTGAADRFFPSTTEMVGAQKVRNLVFFFAEGTKGTIFFFLKTRFFSALTKYFPLFWETQKKTKNQR